MRCVLWLLLACCFSFLCACGSKPTAAVKTDPVPITVESQESQFLLMPRMIPGREELKDRILGDWEMKQDDKKGVAWEAMLPQFEKGKSLVLKIENDGKVKFISPIDAEELVLSQTKYRLNDDGDLEMLLVSVGSVDGVKKTIETVKLRLKATLDGAELTLTDESGGTSRFRPVVWVRRKR